MKPTTTSLGALTALALVTGPVMSASLFWDGTDTDADANGGDGSWDNGLTSNWDDADVAGNAVPWNNANNDTAVFGAATGTATVAVGGVTVGGLEFNTNNYLIQGDPITFGAAGAINVTTGTSKISTDIAGTVGLTKTGNGDLRPTFDNYSFTGDIDVQGGDLIFHNGNNDGVARTLGGGDFTGNINVAAGTTFQFYSNRGAGNPQTFSGVISGDGSIRLAYNTTYNLTGANTYTGKTIFHGEFNGRTATVNVSSLNSVSSPPQMPSSSLGVPADATAGIVDIGRGGMQASAILNYTGPGETTDRVMNIVASGNSTKTVNNLGTGTLTFTEPWIAPAGTGLRMPVTTDSDLILQGFNLPGTPRYLEKNGAARLSVTGPTSIFEYVHLRGGTLEVGSELADGNIYYKSAIETGPGNGGANFIAVPAGTPVEVGMTIAHGRITPGTTIVAITDINADPVVCEISANAGGPNKTEAGTIGFAGALGMMPAAPTDTQGLRWRESSNLKYSGPSDATNIGFTVDGGRVGTWDITNGSTVLEVSGVTAAKSGGVGKDGPGTLVLSGALQHTGNNLVVDGTLLINGDASAMTGSTTVDGTGTLGGTGTIGGNVIVLSTGSLSPGASAGTLSILGDLDLFADGAGILSYELDSLAGPNDLIDVTGSLIIGVDELGFTDFSFTDLGGLQNGTYTLISSGGLNPGDTLDPFDLSGSIGAGTGTLQLNGGDLELVVSGLGASNPYDSWASTNAPGQTPEEDFDLDGVENGVEFVLGGDKDTNDLDKLPGVETTGGNLLFSFERDQASIDPGVTVTIEVGTDLATWPGTFNVGADTGSSDAGVTVTKDSPAAGTDTVGLSVPQAPDAKKFARLKVEISE